MEILRDRLRKEIRKKAKEKTNRIWQEKWDTGTVGRWTHRLIPNIQKWTCRKHGDLNFYLTQALTGHGLFNSFRYRIGKARTDECWYHPGTADTPEHTLVTCQKWREERRQLTDALNIRPELLTIEIIMEGILEKEENWRSFSRFCKEILSIKEEEERKREKELLDNPIMRGTEEDLESADAERMIPLRRPRGGGKRGGVDDVEGAGDTGEKGGGT
ncbi:uncharacterized protein LOC143364422 [Halictus rubicundus]|uniref:uncharacterized protein LOC143363854 n=1 Tax=Halictus rubicundus TaxID=77578 RepID=UPI0040374B23